MSFKIFPNIANYTRLCIRWHVAFIGLVFFLVAWFCPVDGTAQHNALHRKERATLLAMIENSAIFQRGFTGFAFYDPEAREFICSYQGDKYFTPASNAKILTLFGANLILRDKAPIVFYKSNNDTLQLWGTGYPLLYHPDFRGYDTLATWLQSRPEKVCLISDHNYRDERFGAGWSWDDYENGYQMEKAPLPIYGNTVELRKNGHLGTVTTTPGLFQQLLVYEKGEGIAGRLEDRNVFTFGPRALRAGQFAERIPFRYDINLLAQLLQDSLTCTVLPSHAPLPKNYQTLSARLPDTLFHQLMYDSDNYLAEQLLLMSSAKRYGILQTQTIINYLADTVLSRLQSPLAWYDGSGLSRYNQVTPNAMVMVLDQLLQNMPESTLFSYFAAGGVNGTISNWYDSPDPQPYIFAKTGTLRNIHALSGYLRSCSGKRYIFSFFHNNYPGSSRELRREMQKVLEWLYETLE